jgi:hypothetical protein
MICLAGGKTFRMEDRDIGRSLLLQDMPAVDGTQGTLEVPFSASAFAAWLRFLANNSFQEEVLESAMLVRSTSVLRCCHVLFEGRPLAMLQR